MIAVFWIAVVMLAVPAAVFPFTVLVRAALRPRPVRRAAITPPVAIIVAAHNEVRAISAKIDNLLALDYPAERREIVVVSDGSTDGTDAAARAYSARRVRVLALPRVGKADALAAGAAATRAPILAFTDANSMLRHDALRALVAPFADPEVGGVAGDQRYATASADGIAAGEHRYWSFDRMLKRAESEAGSATSATGALYAVRRALFDAPARDATDDFVISTGVIARGARLVFAQDAVAVEPAARSGRMEFARKVRLMTRGMRALVHRRALLAPWRTGWYAFQLLGHKVLRRLAWLPLLTLALAAPFLWDHGVLYQVVTLGQGALYAAGIAGLVVPALTRIKPVALASFFLLANAAAAVATVNLLRGRRIDRWEPEHDVAGEAA